MKPRMQALGVASAMALAQFAAPAQGCSYDDPGSATFQRGVLNLSYPNALYVQGALARSQAAGIIDLPASAGSDLFGSGYRRAAAMLARFGAGLQPEKSDDFGIAVVLIEPMLWTRYTVRDGSVETSVHVNGPQPGDLVIVSAEGALLAVVAHRLSFRQVEEFGLIRFYGNQALADRLRALANSMKPSQ